MRSTEAAEVWPAVAVAWNRSRSLKDPYTVLVSHISGALLCSLSRSLASTHSGMHGAGTHRRRSAADVCAAAFSASPITCRIFLFFVRSARACACGVHAGRCLDPGGDAVIVN